MWSEDVEPIRLPSRQVDLSRTEPPLTPERRPWCSSYMTLAPTEQRWDVVVAGGGFFGCMVALDARTRFQRVLLVERETELLQRASYANQARVHNGYHYPRSLLTGLRSAVSF